MATATTDKRKKIYAAEHNFVYETRFDKTRKDINDISEYLMLGLILFLFPVFFSHPYFVAFITFIIGTALAMNRSLLEKFNKKEPIEEIGLHFTRNDEYIIHMGNAISSIEEVPVAANAMNPERTRASGFNPDAFEYPIIISDKQILTHMFVIGTTGAGKTTFLINILEQLLMLGGGSMAVDGKGDQTVYEAFWNTSVACGREDDFMVINFNQPEKSNTMNPLLTGTADEITDVIGNMLESEGENGIWAGRALSMMKGILSVVVPLRDKGIMFKANGKKHDVMTFGYIGEWIDIQNLKMLYFTIKEANENERLPEMMIGAPEGADIDIGLSDEEKDLYEYIDITRLEQYLSSVYLNIHSPAGDIEEGTSKQHGNSFLMWNEALDLLSGRFGHIFDTESPQILMQDIVSNGRILYILLPALKVDTRTLSVLGKLILGFFKAAVAVLLGDDIAGTVDNRYKSFAIRPRVPFWAVMDEYGAYAVEGFDNVLAQARSLKVSVTILVQEIASLEKASPIEAQRILGNTGIKVVLKLEEQESVKKIMEFLGQKDVTTVSTNQVEGGLDERQFQTSKENVVNEYMLKRLGAGHAYIMWAGVVVPALVRFYEPPVSRVIPEFEKYEESIRPFFFVKSIYPALVNMSELMTEDVYSQSDEEKIQSLNAYFNYKLRKSRSNVSVIDDNTNNGNKIFLYSPMDNKELKKDLDIQAFSEKSKRVREKTLEIQNKYKDQVTEDGIGYEDDESYDKAS